MAKLTGQWKQAGIVLEMLPAHLSPLCQARLYETGDLVLKKMVEHIDKQDLSWQPLAEATVAGKGGDSTVYVASGWLKENLSVRRLKSKVSKTQVFIGASPWKTHKPSGLKFSDLMLYLEYGTDTIPARPLIRPTWEEMEKVIKAEMGDLIHAMVRGETV